MSLNVLTREHFYHVGGNESNRNPMVEAIITNYSTDFYEEENEQKAEQLILLETREAYSA
ncbi:MAG: hypothetical protein C1943_12305 [Halochromatium sp.]|nr:hypothetical protein [Halochromatium sp.]